jgi:hypothetical protein
VTASTVRKGADRGPASSRRRPTNRGLVASKTAERTIYSQGEWTVQYGSLRRPPGRPQRDAPLFRVVAEKIPFGALSKVETDLKARHPKVARNGIYMAHDSMGQVRYIGRGNVFSRLRARQSQQKLELIYFSFYLDMDKRHEREIETVLIRALGAQAYFNTRKKREDIAAGDLRDYEPGTLFYERHYARGRRPSGRR